MRARIQFWNDAPEHNRRRVETALCALQNAGIRDVVPPIDCAFTEILPSYGLAVPAPVSLYRRLAARMASMATERMHTEPARLRLCFMAKRMTSEVGGAMEALCGSARHLLLCLERGSGGEICRRLRYANGVSVVESPSDEQLARTDLYVVFDGWEEPRHLPAKPGSVVLFLGRGCFQVPVGCLVFDGAVLLPPARLRFAWPPGADNEALLAALVAAGGVLPGEIQLSALRTGRKTTPLLSNNMHCESQIGQNGT